MLLERPITYLYAFEIGKQIAKVFLSCNQQAIFRKGMDKKHRH